MWTKRAPEVTPTVRGLPAMVFDRSRGRVLLFGGRDIRLPGDGGTGDALNDTWEWDGSRWTQLTPEVSPPARWGHALAYDGARERIVLFGGRNGLPGLNDTWEWDGETWIERTPDLSPPARWNHALAYDSARQRVILFGGLFGPETPPEGLLGDTWEWDGNEWTERTAAVSPDPRRGHGMAYDITRDRTVLIGGAVWEGSDLSLWEWDGSGWEWIAFFTPRHNIVLVYDSDRGRVVFFGGRWEGAFAMTKFYDDLVEWDGSQWTFPEPSARPPKRSDYGLAYDSVRQELVLFGGTEFDGATWVFGLPREYTCDGLDDDDDGDVDEGCDDDGDGFCDAEFLATDTPAVCPNGGSDCDDGDAAIHPGAADLPGDGLDQDCDGAPACDPAAPWRNHGQFVGCVARTCGRLVDSGAVSREECMQRVRSAAQGGIGR